MTQINLLPWRDHQRKQAKQQAAALLGFCFLSAALLIIVLYWKVMYELADQNARNVLLQENISMIKRQLKELDGLNQEKKKLLLQRVAVQRLHLSRVLMTHLFDELSSIMPSGIYLTQLIGKNKKISLSGYATSSDKVSHLMKNIEHSDWFHHPVLGEIKKLDGTKEAVGNKFQLTCFLGFPDSGQSTL